jgi:hypothetical protein
MEASDGQVRGAGKERTTHQEAKLTVRVSIGQYFFDFFFSHEDDHMGR